MKSWTCLFIVLTVMLSLSVRATTFAQRNLPTLSSTLSNAAHSALLAPADAEATQGLCAIGFMPKHAPVRRGAVSLIKVFFQWTDTRWNPFSVLSGLSEHAHQKTLISHIGPTPSRPPSV